MDHRPARFRGTIERVNAILRILLLVWVLGYLFAACVPLLGGHLVLGVVALAGGMVLFIPWLIGVVVLAVLIRLTNEPRG